MSDGDLKIQYVPLSEVQRWPRNPKDHDIGQLSQSIQRFGYVNPVLIDERTGKLVAGHGRVDTLQAMKAQGETPPRRVKAENGEWYVPVIRGVGFNSDAEAEAYLLADNRLTEIGGWEDQRLAETLSDLAAEGEAMLTGIGFDGDDIDQLLADLEPDGSVEEDEYDGEPPEEPSSQRGEVYELGPHRLMCGDAFEGGDLDKLIGECDTLDCVLTDPPYAIYGSSSGVSSSVADDKMVRPFFRQLFRATKQVTRKFAHIYVHCDWRSYPTLWGAATTAGLTPKNCLVWDKGDGGVGAMYSQCHEFVGFWVNTPEQKTMQGSGEVGERTVHGVGNILRYPRTSGEDRAHNAAKPVALVGEIMEAATQPQETVADLFAGSGTTLIAAEQIGRTCYAMEIDPACCDVIRQRYADFTDQPEYAP